MNTRMRVPKYFLWLSLFLPLLIAACNQEDQATMNQVSIQEKESAQQQAAPTTTLQRQSRSLAAMPSETLPRPRMSDYIDGGSLKKKIKTSFYADNSYVVFYETKSDAPDLVAILVTPDGTSGYQRIDITTLPFEGGTAEASDVFFHDVDNDGAGEMVIIATWQIQHQALGIDAVNYKILAYDNAVDEGTGSLKPLTAIMERLGSGNDGTMEDGPVTFEFTNRQSIMNALDKR